MITMKEVTKEITEELLHEDDVLHEEYIEEDLYEFDEEHEKEIEALEEDASTGVIDKFKKKKKLKAKEDVKKHSIFIEWFQKYLDSVYKSFYTDTGKVIIKPGHEGGFVNLNSEEMVLYAKLINELWDSGVPPLLVFYHEIGHILYTTKELQTYGESLTKEVFMLLNWIEDFYIEDKIMKELYYVKPYIQMLHEVVPDFIDDWEKPHFALHYYYTYEGLTPSWMEKAGIDKQFVRYITQLKHLRVSFGSRFAREKFVRMFEDFYKFCVFHGILTKATPPSPMEPIPESIKGVGKGKGKGTSGELGTGGAHTGKGGGEYGEGIAEEGAKGDTYKEDEGEEVPESTLERKPFKPRDEKKGFDPVFKELIEMLGKEYDKALHDTFKLNKKGKPKLVPRTIPTASPRSMVDPVAIATMRSDIYLEYTMEDFAYTAYNLFIDVSGSVGHNPTFNILGKKIIDIIKAYPYAVYGYGNDVKQWTQKEIDDILKLHCRDGTESPIIGDIILEKKELGNLNIILSDGDLGNLVRRKDIAEITKQYLFIFVVSSYGAWEGYAKAYFKPNQYYTLNKVEDLEAGLKHLKAYIDSKGL